MSFKNSLPKVYQNFLPKKILNLKINETKATCSSCIRACDNRFEYLYKENLKCCTFIPFVPNFAVGGILFHKLAGSKKIEELIDNNQFNLPLGVFPDFKYQYLFQNKKPKDFGQKEDLLCNYYDKNLNQCSIWEFRGVVCTTFFCRSSYGKQGQKLWSGVNDYLSYVEMALAEDCLVLKDFSPRDISDQLEFLNKKDFTLKQKNQTSLSPAELKTYWNGYKDKKAFYLDCYKLVNEQKRASFKEIIGNPGLKLEDKVLELSQCL